MKRTKDIQVTKKDLKGTRLRNEYKYINGQSIADHRENRVRETSKRDAECQFDYKKSNDLYKKRYVKKHEYFSRPKYIYSYQRSRSYTEIGVSSIKAVHKKKVKKIYLPETDDRGVGSSSLSSYVVRRTRCERRNNLKRKTSSKCVGCITYYPNEYEVNGKLRKVGTTRPRVEVTKNIEVGSNTVEKCLTSATTQFVKPIVESVSSKEILHINKVKASVTENRSKEITTATVEKVRPAIKKEVGSVEKGFSSDSLLEHVHNLENSSVEKESRMSLDPMENKLEREYRKIFSSKTSERKQEKTVQELKSASILRRQLEARKRLGLTKKEELKITSVISIIEHQNSVPVQKDVSISSDPPSLVERSYCDINQPTVVHKDIQNISHKERESTTPTGEESHEGIKSMFKVWGEKFDLEDIHKKKASPKYSFNAARKVHKEREVQKITIEPESEHKKKGKKFFFFKKKIKACTKPFNKPKKGMTTGRCEVKNGLMLQMGKLSQGSNRIPKESHTNVVEAGNSYEANKAADRKSWLQRFLTESAESRNSVQVRWINIAGAKSSSDFRLIGNDCYRHTDVVIRSRSNINTDAFFKPSRQSKEDAVSYHKSFTKQQVNFNQFVEAWMIPQIIQGYTNKQSQVNKIDKNNNQTKISKWFIDKSKAFAHKIEVVLHSKSLMKKKEPSSEFLRIDIPKGFFSDYSFESKDNFQSCNSEEVYKIIEYESPDANTDFKVNKCFDTGDCRTSDSKTSISVKDSCDLESQVQEIIIKGPTVHRDVVIQGSDVFVSNKCDVVGVGIITQRNLRDFKETIINITDDFSDDYSDQMICKYQKKCEFAESFLQDYYRNWSPPGIELYSWRVSDSLLRLSENSQPSINNQGDGTKSCPNMYDNYHTTCSPCPTTSEVTEEPDEKSKVKLFRRFKKTPESTEKRVLPKDSFEVFRKRKLYAISNKSQWLCAYESPYSVPSIEDKCAQKSSKESSNAKKMNARDKHKKHVVIPEAFTYMPPRPHRCDCIDDKPGILTFKGSEMYKKMGESNTSGSQTCQENAKTPPCASQASASSHESSSSQDCPSNSLCHAGNNCPSQSASPPKTKAPKPKKPPPLYVKASQVPHKQVSPPPERPSPQIFKKLSLSSCSPRTACLSNCPFGSNSPIHKSADESFLKVEMAPCKKFKSIEKSITPPKSPRDWSPQKPSTALPPSSSPAYLPSFPDPQAASIEMSHQRKPAYSRLPSPISRQVCRKASPPCPPECQKPSSPILQVRRRVESPKSRPSPLCSPEYPTPLSPLNPKVRRKPQSPKSPPSTNSSRSPKSQSFLPRPLECPNSLSPPSPKLRHQPQFQKSSPSRTCPPNCPSLSSSKSSQVYSKLPLPLLPPSKLPQPLSIPPLLPSPLYPQKAQPKASSCPSCERCKQKCSDQKSLSNQENSGECTKPSPSNNQGILKKLSPSKHSKESRPVLKSCDHSTTKLNESNFSTHQRCKDKSSIQEFFHPSSSESKNYEEPKPVTKRISGLHLKIKPASKKTAQQYPSTPDMKLPEIKQSTKPCASASTSEDALMIKRETSSTEEIRGGIIIKVKDADGRTLYERRNYTAQQCNTIEHPSSLIDEMYNLTPSVPKKTLEKNILINNEEVQEAKSESSVANMIEINFNLKLKPGHNDTESYLASEDNECENATSKSVVGKTSQAFFMSKREEDAAIINKNDINIKIQIESLKPKAVKPTKENVMKKKINKDVKNTSYTKTVSTAHSRVLDEQHISIHRTTVGLSSSVNQDPKIYNSCHDMVMQESIKPVLTTINNQESSVHRESKIENIILRSFDNQGTHNFDKEIEEPREKLEHKSEACISATNKGDQTFTLEAMTTTDTSAEIIDKPYSKQEKKEMLKKVFEKVANDQVKNKNRIKQLLKIILTSESTDRMITAASNELANEVCSSLEPNYFQDSSSISNYYINESTVEIHSANEAEEKPIYTTEVQSELSKDSYASGSHENCVCSTLAERLKLPGLGYSCCCRGNEHVDEQTCCDVRTDHDHLLLNSANDIKQLNSASNSKLVYKKFVSVAKSRSALRVTKDTNGEAILNLKTQMSAMNEEVQDISRKETREKHFSKETVNYYAETVDILQSYEAKKAVLEIYAEKTMSNDGEHLVAKLPKFAYGRKVGIERNYEKNISEYKKNIVVMSVKR